jgi:hypothetical protein
MYTAGHPMNSDPSFHWRTFLQHASRDLLADMSIREDLPTDVVASGWLGYAGASDEAIAALEDRLGRRLPPSYRSFLAESDGWRNWGAFIYRLWPCSEVRWFRERNQDWIDAYVQAGPEIEVSDADYFVYDDRQDSCRFRMRYLQSALEVSDAGDSAILLLNPEVVDDAGEWEAWFFANWMPGARRYRSFRDLMQAEHASFQRLQEDQPGKSKYGNAGQRAARRGETDAALALLRPLAAGGDASSAASLAELAAFRGLWGEVIPSLGLVIHDLGAMPNVEGYPLLLLELLARAGRETGHWDRIAELAGAAIAAEEARNYDAYHEHVRAGFLRWFEELRGYCPSGGETSGDVFANLSYFDGAELSLSDEGDPRVRYDAALNEEHAARLRNRPSEYARHCFAVARNMQIHEEMVRIFSENPCAFSFWEALDVARIFARGGDDSTAWEVVRSRVGEWVAAAAEQVAPIELLVDRALSPLMTPERCEEVLATRRGRDAGEGCP